jgi:hypothetical protein
MISSSNNTMVSFRGLSTDTKPTDVANGSRFLEIDTGTVYYFDEENAEWYAVSSGGGGGGESYETWTGGNY